MTWRAPSALTRWRLDGPAVAITCAPRRAASATSSPPVTPPAWTRSVSERTCSAVSAGIGKAAAASQLTPCGLRASSAAGAISIGAQVPRSRSGSGCVSTASPGVQSLTAPPTAVTVPAASTPSAIGGTAPTSQPPSRTNASQLPTPAAATSSSTSSPASGRGSAVSITSTGAPARPIPATSIAHPRPRRRGRRSGAVQRRGDVHDRLFLGRAYQLPSLPVGGRDLIGHGEDEALVVVALLDGRLVLKQCRHSAQTVELLLPELLGTAGLPGHRARPLRHDLVEKLALAVLGARLG